MKIRIRLYLESMGPFFIGVAIKNFKMYTLSKLHNYSIIRACLYIFKSNIFSTILLFLGLLSVISLLFNHNKKGELNRTIIHAKLKESHSFSYTLFVISYLVPLAVISLFGFAGKVFTLLHIGVLGLICVISSFYYKNPILAILGYHLYSVERGDGSYDIIICKGKKQIADNCDVLNASDHVCISKTIVFFDKWYEIFLRFINRQPFAASVIYSTGILFIMLMIGGIQWEGADDFTISQLLMGTMGKPTPYVQVCSYYLGIFIIWLQRLAPLCNWFTVLEIISVWSAFVVFEWFLIKKAMFRNAALALAFPIIFEPMFYMSLTYTRSALLLSFAGWIVLYSAVISDLSPNEEDKKKKSGRMGLSLTAICKIILGIFMIAVGALFRYVCIYVGMAYIIILVFSFTVCCISGRYGRNNIIKVAIFCVTLFFALAICFFLNKQNASLYDKFDKNSDYRAYNKARSDVVDYMPSEFSEDLSSENLEISYNDYYMLKCCIINDKFFSKEYLQLVKDNMFLSDKSSVTSVHNLNQIRMYRNGRLSGKSTLLIVCIGMVFTALVISNKQNRMAIGIDILGTIIIICYFLSGNRLPPWVVDPIYMFAVYIASLEIFAFIELEMLSKCGYKLKKYLLISVLLMCIFGRWKILLYAKSTDYKSVDLYETIQYAEASEDIFLLGNIDLCPYPYIDVYGPLEYFEEGQWDNIIRVGNWDVEHPARNLQKEALGIDSVIYSMVEGKSKLISNINSSFKMYETFFMEHYDLNVGFRVVKSFGSYGIFEAYVLSD